MIAWVMPIVSAIAYRLRGSSWFSNDYQMRGLRLAKLCVGALPVGLSLWLCGISFYICVVVTAFVMAADSLPHGSYQGTTNVAQGLLLTMNSIIAASAPFAALVVYHHNAQAIVAAICSLLVAPSYFVGGKIPVHIQIGPVGFNQGPEIGEVLYGLTRTLFVFG